MKKRDKQIYQVQVHLKRSKPKIWRRLLLPADLLLSDLHKILQTTMGWTNGHLHQFVHGKDYFEPPAPEGEIWDHYGTNYTDFALNFFLKKTGDKMVYEYDFGDGWEHEIKLEKILPFAAETLLPQCIAGKRACPPEDSGGVWGYEQMLKVLKNPKHPEYEMYREWLPGGFDPEFLDIEEINQLLQTDDYGCPVW
jgi:hypothetical protein